MTPKKSLTSFCKELLTVAGLSALATFSVSFPALSATTEIANKQNSIFPLQELNNNSFTNLLNGEKPNFLIADDDYDDDDDDDKKRRSRYRYDDDKKYRGRKYRKGKYRSSKYHRVKDWNCYFKVGRLYNNRSLILHLDILEKPPTKYANVVYQAYARKDGRWVKFYTNTGARLIKRRGSRYYLEPEVIEFSKLRDRNINYSKSDIRFVTQIRYDTQRQRDQRLVFENVWNYSAIQELSSVNQITTVSSTTISETRDSRNTYSRRDDYRRVDNRRDGYNAEENFIHLNLLDIATGMVSLK